MGLAGHGRIRLPAILGRPAFRTESPRTNRLPKPNELETLSYLYGDISVTTFLMGQSESKRNGQKTDNKKGHVQSNNNTVTSLECIAEKLHRKRLPETGLPAAAAKVPAALNAYDLSRLCAPSTVRCCCGTKPNIKPI